MQRDVAYLVDIFQAARMVGVGVGDISKAQFLNDWMRQSAVIRQLEIIGEATKHLSEDFKRNHPAIPWRSMAGMRDILIHAYAAVDLEEVWKAAQEDIPRLIALIEPLIPSQQ
ncbi:MAG TPA: DUF86 domain-containing protein [Anaerolineae bacterium]|nr:DUF86 domain-containing protein [Anaerolineae bacterium]